MRGDRANLESRAEKPEQKVFSTHHTGNAGQKKNAGVLLIKRSTPQAAPPAKALAEELLGICQATTRQWCCTVTQKVPTKFVKWGIDGSQACRK